MNADLDLLLGGKGVSRASVHIGHRTARTRVTVYERFVACVFNHLPYVVQHRRSVNFVNTAVCH